MSQEQVRAAIQSAIDYLTSHPDEAAYTDSLATARLAETGALRVDVSGPEGASVTTDMPTSVGGTNSAPSAGWLLRAAEASAMATLIAMRSAQLAVPISELEVSVDSESNDFGILGIGDEVPAGPLSTRVAVLIRSDAASGQELRDIVDWAFKHSPPLDAVRRAVPMTLEVDAGD